MNYVTYLRISTKKRQIPTWLLGGENSGAYGSLVHISNLKLSENKEI